MGWTVRGSNPGRSKRYLSSPSTSRPTLGSNQPPIQKVNSLPGVKGPGMMLTTHLRLAPTLKMSIAIPLLPVYDFMALPLPVSVKVAESEISTLVNTNDSYSDDHRSKRGRPNAPRFRVFFSTQNKPQRYFAKSSNRSRGSSAGVVTKSRPGQPGNRSLITGTVKIFFFSKASRQELGPIQPLNESFVMGEAAKVRSQSPHLQLALMLRLTGVVPNTPDVS